MFKLAVLSMSFVVTTLSIGACATGTLNVERADGPRGTARLELGLSDETTSSFPKVVEHAVPSVDRIARRVRAELGDTATAALELCVSPTGAVVKAELVESSSFAELDAALVRDAKHWKFTSMPGPATLKTCSRATIAYHPY